ncbi:RabGAP/TBC [Macrolepiota fuliginosa MF-IS2]|uniref:RabGAP/TBC n=1 Tax=Macrolepiota fuliginosa MF-IS2 TaxID=1400762 RepID=A0A9P6C9M7_9AGAR|nr:RabGAP/TBC [Macrolepiota fuliginosa MF-IS2]
MHAQDIPTEIPIHHVSPFDTDDAFTVSDEQPPFTFSSDNIRVEIARDLGTAWPHRDGLESPPVNDPNTSVSTLDIDAQQSLPELDTDDSAILSSEFSHISLSTDAHGVEHCAEPDNHGQSDAPYPAIIIDASDAPTHKVIQTPGPTVSTPNSSSVEPSPAPSTRSLPPETMPYSSDQVPSPEPASASTPTIPPLSIATNTYNPSAPSETKNAQSPQKPTHRPARSTGPSMFEKVRSKTRPTFLPPKPRAEDEKHLADWHNMMKLSRLAADKRRKALQERRTARERQIEASLQLWEKEIVPDWRIVHKNPQLRKIWWKGIPIKLRGPMWEKAVGNSLALSKEHYRSCLSRAKRALAANVFPKETLDLIEQDIRSTIPSLHLFHPEIGPMYTDLKDMLYAWVVARSDEGLGYTHGAAKIAGMMLITMPAQQAFNVMRNLLERHCMHSFYGGERSKDDVEAYYRIFDTLLADGMPKIYFNFKQHQISPAAYLSDWLVTLFLDHLPFEACARIWDVIMLEGDAFLYRAALGILAVLEPRLFFPERKELLELLQGENKAALEVAKREGQTLDGGKYEIYGVDEETLWERIDAMDDWWKESTWIRLIQRELPDL